MNKNIKQYMARAVPIVVFALLPLVMCFVFCMKDGKMIGDVYLANSQWNDEPGYYKSIGSLARYNGYLGFWGYNETHAAIGGNGAWSPVLLIFHIMYAKMFGWSLMSPIWCNIALMMIAMAVFAWLVKPTKSQMAWLSLFYGCNTLITRYVLSGMIETVIYFLLILFLGIAIKAYRTDEGVRIPYAVALNVVTVLLTLMRPYWVMLFVVPVHCCYGRYRKKSLIQGVVAMVCLVPWFLIAKYFCAPYFSPIVNLEWLKLLVSNPVAGIKNVTYILFSSIWKLLWSIGEGIISGSPEGGAYVPYVFAIGVLSWQYRRLLGHRGIKKRGVGYTLFCLIAMLMAIFYLYDIRVGSRHALAFVFGFSLLHGMWGNSEKEKAVLAAILGWVFLVRATDAYTYSVPMYTPEKALELSKGEAQLRAEEMIDMNTDNPWDNTMIYVPSDNTGIDFTYIYAVPYGICSNTCTREYVLGNWSDLKSKYIITNMGEEIDQRCQNEGRKLMAEYGSVHVWKLRE